MELVADQKTSSQRNTALHSWDDGSNKRPQYATVCDKEAKFWDSVLSPYERAGLLHRAGLDESGFFNKWEHFSKAAHYKIRMAIKKAATWQTLAGIH